MLRKSNKVIKIVLTDFIAITLALGMSFGALAETITVSTRDDTNNCAGEENNAGTAEADKDAAEAGDSVNVWAGASDEYLFSGWTGNVTFDNPECSETSFVMGAAAAEIVAHFIVANSSLPDLDTGKQQPENVPVEVTQPQNDDSVSQGTQESETEQSTSAVDGVVATPEIIVGGKIYKSTVSGAFVTKNIAIAVAEPFDKIASKAGLGAGESLYFKGWEFTAKRSPLAYKSLADAAGSIGGNVLQCIELEFGKSKVGKFTELDERVVSRTTISLPKKADKNKKHALARAAKGGKTQILENISEDPNVITSDIPGGAAAYAVVEY